MATNGLTGASACPPIRRRVQRVCRATRRCAGTALAFVGATHRQRLADAIDAPVSRLAHAGQFVRGVQPVGFVGTARRRRRRILTTCRPCCRSQASARIDRCGVRIPLHKRKSVRSRSPTHRFRWYRTSEAAPDPDNLPSALPRCRSICSSPDSAYPPNLPHSLECMRAPCYRRLEW